MGLALVAPQATICVPLAEGDELAVGAVRPSVLETPGHTPESVSYVVRAGADAPPRGFVMLDLCTSAGTRSRARARGWPSSCDWLVLPLRGRNYATKLP